MKTIEKRCIIGEGPIWNEWERCLYYTNTWGGKEICKLDVYSGNLTVRPVNMDVSAFAFCKDGKMIVSRHDGAFILNDDDTIENLYDTSKYNILYGNDMKVGPDGRIYIGTQSSQRMGVSDAIDGKLFSIDKNGDVRVVIDNLVLSNGLDWSCDEKRFYHTDSGLKIIREYNFDSAKGEAEFTGRSIEMPGVDGFTIDENDDIYAACWGKGYIAVIDTKDFKVKKYINIPARATASCTFAGDDMEILAVTTATLGEDIEKDKNAGFTFLENVGTHGRKPYLFG